MTEKAAYPDYPYSLADGPGLDDIRRRQEFLPLFALGDFGWPELAADEKASADERKETENKDGPISCEVTSHRNFPHRHLNFSSQGSMGL